MTVLREPDSSFPYRIEQWPAADDVREDQTVPERAKGWLRAVSMGFHGRELTDEAVAKYVRVDAADDAICCGVYPETIAERGLPAEWPVGTFGSMKGTLNVGATGTVDADNGRFLDALMITAVTVRPSHRRRGILSQLVRANLEQAAAEGLPVAALTASEGAIYGRFGFGEATRERTIEIDTRPGFALRREPERRVEVIPVERAGDVQAELFEVFHRSTLGSLTRPESYKPVVSGQWGSYYPEADPEVRAAVHYGADGGIDGYVSYKAVRDGDKLTAHKVVDLLALTPEAYLGLWAFLGSLDLSPKVTWSGAPVADPLFWAVNDQRRYRVVDEGDLLWLRPLDVPAMLEARQYHREGTLRLGVRDDLGFAEGDFELRVEPGAEPGTLQGRVRRLEAGEEPEVVLPVAALGSLYLGDASARLLREAGRVELTEEQAGRFDKLFTVPQLPDCRTNF
ncbi:GNAT family N-acetyltransferase [Acaricomes phytoseiuli]|uniref:GNAT family N-acetyltransferase n=1 Tax=Acaricomes phytoseiuli TaxID=291968 RepID=UPI002222C118|nr:GNAT family N-acetyltransferase [Acaricomes phytoseiuli]MCW1249092.1 GNAT family N-acetyltransferase [Acaricomes phytoseiuli]